MVHPAELAGSGRRGSRCPASPTAHARDGGFIVSRNENGLRRPAQRGRAEPWAGIGGLVGYAQGGRPLAAPLPEYLQRQLCTREGYRKIILWRKWMEIGGKKPLQYQH